MSKKMDSQFRFYIGWDVGAWNCDKNPISRDAIIILDGDSKIVGQWRNNLTYAINDSTNASDFIKKIFALCGEKAKDLTNVSIIMAIDAPLGFPDGFKDLINGKHEINDIGQHKSNPYLFRKTEQLLFGNDLSPLSPIKDMIGSQSTKAMHVLAKFGIEPNGIGVWNYDNWLSVIETYPSALKKLIVNNSLPKDSKKDILDAWLCAELAILYDTQIEKLNKPLPTISKSEGWIWTMK